MSAAMTGNGEQVAAETGLVTSDVEPSSEASPTAGGSPIEGSTEAKRLAAAILEVLAGARGPSEAAEVLGISLCRYYQLETRALAGLLVACEPRRRGGGRKGPSELATLRQECERLRRECARQQALVRAAQRTVGLAPLPPPPAPAAKTTGTGRKRRKRRPKARALKMVARLREEGDTPPVADAGTAASAATAPEVTTAERSS